MSITSLGFVLFVSATLLVYYLMPRRPQNYWLLLVSYAFYITWAWQFAVVLLVLTLGTFFLAHRVRVDGQGRRGALWIAIGLNLMVLLFFRSANFFLPDALALLARLGLQTQAGALQILLPVGLSFYVLANISYLMDVHRGQLEAVSDIVEFALYLAYFPKLLAGPIERARSFVPKLRERRVVDNDVLARSFTLIVVGAVRKLLIADYLAAIMFPDVFDVPGSYAANELWTSLLMYALFLYNDFAGYTSIVRGVSGLFGIELSVNFAQPYFARNFAEFWNRWHITLSHWLRDYIYFPLSRTLLRRNPSRRNVPNLVLPPLVTMLVSGLWHGLSWNMLLWGGLHGLYQVLERIPSLWRPVVAVQQLPRWRQGAAMAVVFLLVLLAWVPFRMELPVAFQYWRGMFGFTYQWISLRLIMILVPLFAATAAMDGIQLHYRDEAAFVRWPRWAQAGLLAVSAALILLLTVADQGDPFVYQGF
jgi:alginate O-acetyltransferase complex protein AlgI